MSLLHLRAFLGTKKYVILAKRGSLKIKPIKMPDKQYYVYILTNKINTVVYIGITSDLTRRIYEHKSKLVDGFSKKYNLDKLVYYEMCGDVITAIKREKQIKHLTRKAKEELINKHNCGWNDLYNTII